jgi:peptidoglycan L-alanyl-D-glutamate endopeptidase CwlK
MINSRDIKDLHPKMQVLCNQFIAKCKDDGITVIITSTYRDFESQNALYAQGRTTPGKIVTNAKAGQSFHNFRVAFDFCPTLESKAIWNDTLLFIKCGQIGKSLGLEWGGDWKTIKDLPHLQFTNGLSLAEFQAGKTID